MTPDAEPTLTAAWPPPADRPAPRYAPRPVQALAYTIGTAGFALAAGTGAWMGWHLAAVVVATRG